MQLLKIYNIFCSQLIENQFNYNKCGMEVSKDMIHKLGIFFWLKWSPKTLHLDLAG